METIETLDPTPFKHLVMSIGALPTSFVDGMSYYECMAWLVAYIRDKVVPACNNNAEAIKEIQDWIETLDLQDEVDNKLDEMKESGELAEIISQYLNSTAIFAYDSVAAMKAAENLIDGSYARTTGYYTANDGGGALYKIRNVTNDDTIDEAFIVEMNDSQNQLVAEMIIENETINFRQLGAKSEEDTNYAHTDCKTYIDKYIAKLNTLGNKTISLFIPSGIWCFSETLLNRQHGFNIYGEKSFVISTEGSEKSTIIVPVADNQKHIWKIGGNASYSTTAQVMVYDWNLNNLIFSTAYYTTNRVMQGFYHVTKAALYLDGVTAGRCEFLQFDQVDGTALAITSSWENYFGTINFRRVYDFSSPAMLFDTVHPITGAGSPDISAISISNMMFEGINGDMIYSMNDSNLSELQIDNLNIENRLVTSIVGRESGTIVTNNSNTEADHHYSIFNLGRAIGVMINQIKLSNMVNYRFTDTNTGETSIVDRIFTFRENAFVQMTINSIICNYNRGLTTLIYKPDTYMVNQRCRMIINNWLAYSEQLPLNLPVVDVKYFPTLRVNNCLDGMSVIRPSLGAIPLYYYCVSQGNNQYLYTDSGALNPLKLACRRKYDATNTFAQLQPNVNYDMIVRIKAKNGISGRIDYRCTLATASAEALKTGPSYTGNDDWQEIRLNIPELKEGTRLVLVDYSNQYASNDDVTIFDSITLVPRATE